MKIPTQKGKHSCKCTELSLEQKEGIDLYREFCLIHPYLTVFDKLMSKEQLSTVPYHYRQRNNIGI